MGEVVYFVSLFLCLFVWSNVWQVSSLKSHSLCQNSKVALTHWLTKVRYRAARAANNHAGTLLCSSLSGLRPISRHLRPSPFLPIILPQLFYSIWDLKQPALVSIWLETMNYYYPSLSRRPNTPWELINLIKTLWHLEKENYSGSTYCDLRFIMYFPPSLPHIKRIPVMYFLLVNNSFYSFYLGISIDSL